MKRVKPERLRLGDTVGIVAPASGVFNPSTIYFGQQLLEDWGYRVKLGQSIYRRHGYLAGTDQERLEDLHQMFADPQVKAIICLRGGYGALRLVEQLDYQLIRENPKVFLGFSDITALHIAISQQTGLITFHGPVINKLIRGLTSFTKESMLKTITQSKPFGVLTNPPNGPNPFSIAPGKGSGQLVGGNLSLICATMGTPYELDTRGKILFLEEVGEEPYRIDRMLTQLELAGKFAEVKGIIFGQSVECVPRAYQPSFYCTFSLEEILMEKFKEMQVPVLYNLTCGHGKDCFTLPVGVAVTLDADEGVIKIREGAVS